MKGIIIDLDETLWGGIVGEVSVEGVIVGGVYAQFQTLLSKLASEGYLLAISSKNSEYIVKEVFKRRPLLVDYSSFFPVKANYNNKSKSVSEILAAWNILAKDVVFVDDRTFELEEVKRNHPDITVLQVPTSYDGYEAFFTFLRECFPKKEATQEDKLRLESIRSGLDYSKEESKTDPEEFHKSLEAEITVHKGFTDRAFELVNKTNQFTINGLRIMSDDMEILKGDPGSVCYTFEYKDRFGPLGVVGVVMGFEDTDGFYVAHMAVSCRAFSRRLEHVMIDYLFSIGYKKINLLVLETASNEPARNFASEILGKLFFGGFDTITKEQFDAKKPKLYQRVICPNCV